DVYRVFVPPRRRVRVVMKPTRNAELEVWGPSTRTVKERGAARKRDLQGVSTRTSTTADSVVVANKTGRGEVVYVDVFLAAKIPEMSVSGSRITLTTVSTRSTSFWRWEITDSFVSSNASTTSLKLSSWSQIRSLASTRSSK